MEGEISIDGTKANEGSDWTVVVVMVVVELLKVLTIAGLDVGENASVNCTCI